MEPVDTTDIYFRRQDALALAVQYAQGRPGFSAESVLDVAHEFLWWLTHTEGDLNG